MRSKLGYLGPNYFTSITWQGFIALCKWRWPFAFIPSDGWLIAWHSLKIWTDGSITDNSSQLLSAEEQIFASTPVTYSGSAVFLSWAPDKGWGGRQPSFQQGEGITPLLTVPRPWCNIRILLRYLKNPQCSFLTRWSHFWPLQFPDQTYTWPAHTTFVLMLTLLSSSSQPDSLVLFTRGTKFI